MKIPKTFACLLLSASTALAVGPIDIGKRLELFVDDHLIAEMTGDVAQKLLKPTPQEVVLVTIPVVTTAFSRMATSTA
jgi:hypothetical protein